MDRQEGVFQKRVFTGGRRLDIYILSSLLTYEYHLSCLCHPACGSRAYGVCAHIFVTAFLFSTAGSVRKSNLSP